MTVEFLGSGTSHGIPVIACDCRVCKSSDNRDNRMRSSLLITGDFGEQVLIDCGPEFRMQALRCNRGAGLKRVDGVLLTHSHADHLHGIDDLRIFSFDPFGNFKDIDIYSNELCITDFKKRFSYVFCKTQEGGGKPHFSLHVATETVKIGNLEFLPVPVFHGELSILGWRVKNFAYLTDCSKIPETSYSLLKNLDTLVIDGLREKPHSTHFNFWEALQEVAKILPKRAFFTHISHSSSHEEIIKIIAEYKKSLPVLANTQVLPAYDGLVLKI